MIALMYAKIRYFIGYLCLELVSAALAGPEANISNIMPSSTAYTLRPQLSCILFGDHACQLSCEIFCDMYGCQSNGSCSNDVYCDCQERYNVSGRFVDASQYRTLPLDDLFNSRFRPSNFSSKLKAILKSNTELAEQLLADLRNPHTIVPDILTKFPTRSGLNLSSLEMAPSGVLGQYVTQQNTFDHDKFRRYVEQKLEAKYDDVLAQLKNVKRREGFDEMIKCIRNEEDVKYVMRQLFLFPSDFIKLFAQQNGYDIGQVLSSVQPSTSAGLSSRFCYQSPCLGEISAVGFINDTAYRDEVLMAGTMETFIEVVSSYDD